MSGNRVAVDIHTSKFWCFSICEADPKNFTKLARHFGAIDRRSPSLFVTIFIHKQNGYSVMRTPIEKDFEQKSSGPGEAATRIQRALELAKSKEKQRRIKSGAKLADLNRAAKLEQSRLQRINREKMYAQERRFAGLLGRIVLNNFRQHGMTSVMLSATDIRDCLKTEDLLALQTLSQTKLDIDLTDTEELSDLHYQESTIA